MGLFLVTENIVFISGLHALDVCDKKFYPNIHELLKIFCTLPSSTAIHLNDVFQVFIKYLILPNK